MRLATVQQAKEIDSLSSSKYGLTAEVLMESAGALAAREVDISFLPELTRGTVAVVCGPGNNGGDALVLARQMHSSGFRDLYVLLLAPNESRSELFKKQLERAELQGLRILDLHEDSKHKAKLQTAALIIDGLFGIGLNKRVGEPYSQLIEAMNAAKAPKVSLDCPSGLNCDTGRVEGVCVRASLTITFGLAKPGFFVAEGPSHVGKLRILPIGFPYEAARNVATSHFLFTERLARRYLPTRSERSNKSDHGCLLVVAGSPGYWGAGILSSTSAFRMGAGYVIWASFEAPYEALKEIPEVLTARVDDEQIWHKKPSAVAIGPGLAPDKNTAQLIEKLRKMDRMPVVLDAGGIQACVDHGLFPLPEHWLITPHAGELSRLLKTDVQEIEQDRFAAVFAATQKAKCHVLLKGFRSLIAHEERCLIIHSGNSALAKAGTGDVLTGMIGALMAQGLETAQAAATGAYLHGRLADEWVRTGNDKASLTASDLKEILPQVVSRLRSGGSYF